MKQQLTVNMIVTTEPRGDEPRLTDFVMHELVTVDFRNVDCHLGLGRPGGPKGKDGYKGDAHAFPWHKDPPLKKSQFSQSDPLVVPILSTAWNTTCWVQRGQDGRHTVREARGAPPTRWPSRLVATAAEDRLSIERNLYAFVAGRRIYS